jgi:hypothetical protein
MIEALIENPILLLFLVVGIGYFAFWLQSFKNTL